MKNLMIITLIGFIGIMGKSFADTSMVGTTKIRVPVKHVYVPKGFDSNDNVEVVVTGVLPNLCYYAPTVEVSVADNKIQLEVVAFYRAGEKALCPLVVVPFMLTARVGLLDKGNYTIVANGGITADQNAKMNITEALSPLVDEHVYANVDGVTRNPGTRTVTLDGYNPSDCYQLDHIDAVSNAKDTIALLPIMKQVRPFCPMKMTPFSFQYEIPALLNEKEFLVHVRSMKGASVNYLFVQEE